MNSRIVLSIAATFVLAAVCISQVNADPCGMVPPIYNGSDPPIVRIGLQKTYVFHKDGIETFVIHPGFSGKVDEFGMLIPFPSIPSLRKAPDNIFAHVANAIDPPEIVIDLTPPPPMASGFGGGGDGFGGGRGGAELEVLRRDEVRVVKEEAVGMYEVAVLEAGSAKALKKWMDQNRFRYPNGMDKVTEEYIGDGWCFVAVKTKVAEKSGVDPKPGQRSVDAKLEDGSSFDGSVQAMGFRFKTDELVVPMRLSTFNEGELRNVVYVLSDNAQKIVNIPDEYVVRQVSGEQLHTNITEPLPLRLIGGRDGDRIPARHRKGLKERRDPEPKNGQAKRLFASDLRATQSKKLSLPFEEKEKELLQINEFFKLRGSEMDEQVTDALKRQQDSTERRALSDLASMTMTVIDGDFPREVLRRENLKFASYKMPDDQNNSLKYDAKRYGPGPKLAGRIIQTVMVERKKKETNSGSSEIPLP